jgi:hybrid cluster-associated redox disulfide protein
MAASTPKNDMTVAEVLDLWPETVAVFQELKTACVGCVMAPFDTMVDVAREYDLDLDQLMDALDQAVIADEENNGRGSGLQE